MVEPGAIRPGDEITVQRSSSGLRIVTQLRAWMGDVDEMRAALVHDDLDAESRHVLTRMLAKRTISAP